MLNEDNWQWVADYEAGKNGSPIPAHIKAGLTCEEYEEIIMKAPQSNSTSFEKHPAGSCRLVVSRLLDKGTVYNHEKEKEERKFSIYFESEKLMTEGDYAGQPFLVVDNFNYSMYQNSHLCKRVEDMLGRRFKDQAEADNFDLSTLVGKTAFANIVHSDDGKWVNVGSIMPLPDGMQPLEIKGMSFVFDMDNIDMAVYEKLSDRIKEGIQKSQEWGAKESAYGTPNSPIPSPPVRTEESFDDRDIPF